MCRPTMSRERDASLREATHWMRRPAGAGLARRQANFSIYWVGVFVKRAVHGV